MATDEVALWLVTVVAFLAGFVFGVVMADAASAALRDAMETLRCLT